MMASIFKKKIYPKGTGGEGGEEQVSGAAGRPLTPEEPEGTNNGDIAQSMSSNSDLVSYPSSTARHEDSRNTTVDDTTCTSRNEVSESTNLDPLEKHDTRNHSPPEQLYKWAHGKKWDSIMEYLERTDRTEVEKHLNSNSDPKPLLHLAIEKKAPVNVIMKKIDIGGKTLAMGQDQDGKNALHYAYRYNADIIVIRQLLEICGAKEIAMAQSRTEWIPLHYAVSNAVSVNIINDLFKKVGEPCAEEMVMKDNHKKRDSLFYACRYYDDPVDIVNRLLEVGGQRYLMSPSFSDNLKEMDRLPERKRDLILESSMVRDPLNQKVVRPFSLAVLFLDVIFQLMFAIVLSFYIKSNEKIPSNSLGFLASAICWFGLRETVQLANSDLYAYCRDPSNYLDLLQITVSLLLVTSSVSRNVDPVLLIVCIGAAWSRLVFTCGNLNYNIAVFLSAFLAIIRSLQSFIFVTVIIVIAFSHMFFAAGPPEGVACPLDSTEIIDDVDYENGAWSCRLSDAYFQCFSMLLGDNLLFVRRRPMGSLSVHSILMLLYAFVIVILLLNIIIAVINLRFQDIQREGQKAFWLNRLRIVNELESTWATATWMLQSLGVTLGGESRKPDIELLNRLPERRMLSERDERNYDEWKNFGDDYANFISWYRYGIVEYKPTFWKRLAAFVQIAEWKEIVFPSVAFQKVVMGVETRKHIEGIPRIIVAKAASVLFSLAVLVFAAVSFASGIITCGYLWPKELKRSLFYGQTEKEVENEIEKLLRDKIDRTEEKLDRLINLFMEQKNRNDC